jgi:hypothetical protein
MANDLWQGMHINAFRTTMSCFDACYAAAYVEDIYAMVKAMHPEDYEEFTERVLLIGANFGVSYCVAFGGSQMSVALLNAVDQPSSAGMSMGSLFGGMRARVEDGLYPNELPSAVARDRPVSRYFGPWKQVFNVTLPAGWLMDKRCRSGRIPVDEASMKYRTWFMGVVRNATGREPEMDKYDRPSAPLGIKNHEKVEDAALAKLGRVPGCCYIYFMLLSEAAELNEAAVLRAIEQTPLSS